MEFYNQSGFQSPNVYPSTNTASYNYNPYNYSYPGGYQPHYYKPDNSYSYYPNSSTTSHNDSGYEPSFYLTASPTAGQYAHSASFQSNQFNSSSFFESSPTSSGLADSKPKLADSKRGIVDVADESLTLEDSSTTQATNSTKRQRIAKLDNLNNRDTTYRCVKCFRDFNSAARFLMHQHRVHLKRSSTECPICSKLSFFISFFFNNVSFNIFLFVPIRQDVWNVGQHDGASEGAHAREGLPVSNVQAVVL
jgi:hypothetical protein